jgi:dermatan 4-sulfotransferase 1
VDRKNKLLYCYIPKVASSNIKRLILTLQNLTDDSNAIKYFDQRGFEFLSDVTPHERNHFVSTFFKFLFVRQPLDRILSAYRNKFQEKNVQFELLFGREIVRKYRKPSVTSNRKGHVTFQEFVRYLIDKENPLQQMNEHWMPMYELCQPCYMNYDFVGSFEDLDFDTSALLAKLHAPKRVTFPKKQSFYGKHLDKKGVARFYMNLTAEEYKSLHGRYMDDFKCFSYKFSNQRT